MNYTTGKIGDWTVKANKEAMAKDPANNKTERYLLQGVECGYTLWDSVEKTYIKIKGEKRWAKWQNEHKGEWRTDF